METGTELFGALYKINAVVFRLGDVRESPRVDEARG
jgi:hypothetical protein